MKKILYIEDELFLGKIVKESLETKGYIIAMETDGAAAMQCYKHFEPDVCVLDIMLPNKSGFEIAKEIRELHSTMPIIFLTAKTTTQDVVDGFKFGANDYIRKPFSIEELIVRIENVARQFNNNKQSNETELIHIGNYQLQINKQILVHQNHTQKLSFRETALLQYLYDSNSQIVNRTDVLKHIWGSTSLFNSRNLDVYINKIRGYLKQDNNLEIVTIKGIGYRFIVQ